MKAKIINKENENCGRVCDVIEIFDKFICLEIEGKKIDYGFSEIEIIAKTDKEKYELGKTLVRFKANNNAEFKGFMRQSEIAKFVKNISFPAPIKNMSSAINFYVWN